MVVQGTLLTDREVASNTEETQGLGPKHPRTYTMMLRINITYAPGNCIAAYQSPWPALPHCKAIPRLGDLLKLSTINIKRK